MKRIFNAAVNNDKTRIIAAVILAVAAMAYFEAFKSVLNAISKW